jgi:hypothetical protein
MRSNNNDDMKAIQGGNLVMKYWVWCMNMVVEEDGVGTDSKPGRVVEDHWIHDTVRVWWWTRGSWIQEREEDNLVWMNIEGMNWTCRRRYEEKAVGICIETSKIWAECERRMDLMYLASGKELVQWKDSGWYKMKEFEEMRMNVSE